MVKIILCVYIPARVFTAFLGNGNYFLIPMFMYLLYYLFVSIEIDLQIGEHYSS